MTTLQVYAKVEIACPECGDHFARLTDDSYIHHPNNNTLAAMLGTPLRNCSLQGTIVKLPLITVEVVQPPIGPRRLSESTEEPPPRTIPQ